MKYVTASSWFEYPGEEAQCHFTSRDIPPVPGVPYISPLKERTALTWQEASSPEEFVSFELQERRGDSGNWSTIYSDVENYHFLTGFKSGNSQDPPHPQTLITPVFCL